MKPITKTRLILGGLVAVHVVLQICTFRWVRGGGVFLAALQSAIPTQGVLLRFWVAMGRKWWTLGVHVLAS